MHQSARPLRAPSALLSLFILLLGLSLTACGSENSAPDAAPQSAEFSGFTPTPTLLPTPTLAPVLQAEAPPVESALPALGDGSGAGAAEGGTAVPSAANPEAAPDSETGGSGPNALPAAAQPENPQPPTATPEQLTPSSLPPAEQLALADSLFEYGNYAAAALEYRRYLLNESLGGADQAAATYAMGKAAYLQGDWATAQNAFERYLTLTETPRSEAYFFLATVNPDGAAALDNYTRYLDANPDMGSYIYPRMALVAPERAQEFLSLALESSAYYRVTIDIRRQLADAALAAGDYAEAIAQYSVIRDLAQTEFTKGEMTYKIGSSYLLLGDTAAAQEAFQTGINQYPRAFESYLGLVELINNEIPVNQYQRGLTNFYAGNYEPAVLAFETVISETVTAELDPQTYLFLAWSQEGLGQLDPAQASLIRYLESDPENLDIIGTYWIEKAALETRQGQYGTAQESLQSFIAAYPEHPEAAWAAWRSGQLADRFELNFDKAIPLYEAYVTAYPQAENVSDAYYRLGMLQRFVKNDQAAALANWEAAAAGGGVSAESALVWLLRSAPQDEALIAQAEGLTSGRYYALRAQDIAAGLPAYAPSGGVSFEFDEAADQAEVEGWIRSHFGLGEEVPVSSQLDPAIATDPAVVRGEKLWELGEFQAAKAEFEVIRQTYADNAQLSYQLALYFRDIGLYRSSILAAAAVLTRANVTVFDAPPLIGRLAYPAYYTEGVLAEAERYGYDPLLQLALMRQESLFESFIASSAAAQGLMQIIPATGEYIATQLGWSGYQESDLYKPYLNITFGSFYLDQQLDLFDGSVAPALSAYNAGPGNALRWYESAGSDHDLYLETVNFSETRTYIQRIYQGHAVYKFLYGAVEE